MSEGAPALTKRRTRMVSPETTFVFQRLNVRLFRLAAKKTQSPTCVNACGDTESRESGVLSTCVPAVVPSVRHVCCPAGPLPCAEKYTLPPAAIESLA